MLKYFIAVQLTIFTILSCLAQDSLKVMQYNLMYYGKNTSFCTSINNNIDKKDSCLRTIFGYVQPDVLCVNEMGTEDSLANRILNKNLNINGKNYYKRAQFTNSPGSLICNMLFYNSGKLTLYKQQVIANDTSGNPLVRLIDLYTLFYNDLNLSKTHDTTFITFCEAHLKASSTTADQSEREQATAALMEFIHSKPGNYILSGDFNLQSSSEASYQNLINGQDSSTRFYDPISQSGTWNNNIAFSKYHTQATHVSGSCFAGSGLDDRFDFILASNYIMNDSAKVQYINGSYTAVGQDGNHFDLAVNDNVNSSVPPEVSNALYNSSDHLPVALTLKLDVTPKPQIINSDPGETTLTLTNPFQSILQITLFHENLNRKVFARVFSLTGKLLLEEELIFKGSYYELSMAARIPEGFYILKITDDDSFSINRKILKD